MHLRKGGLLTAVRDGHEDVVKTLLDAGANINTPSGKDDRFIPLILAVRRKDAETVKTLLDAGANVNVRNKDGKTPVDIAVENNLKEIVQLFNTARPPQ